MIEGGRAAAAAFFALFLAAFFVPFEDFVAIVSLLL
jgi:hypothetical protein